MVQPYDFETKWTRDRGVWLVLSKTSENLSLDLLHIDQAIRGQGIARQVLLEVCSYADGKQLPVKLLAGDPFTWAQRELVSFYSTFGFRVSGRKTTDGCVPMRREPQQIP